jgi:hypothetical protein
MSRVSAFDNFYSFSVSKKFSRSNCYGRANYGFSQYGHEDELAAIYQKKYFKNGPAISKENFYWPTNPRTPEQQSWREVFKNGKEAWQLLPNSEKKFYREKAKSYHFTGFNLFMRYWLKSHVT